MDSVCNHYQYDVNGNMTRDDYKAASVSYNSFNLPSEIDFGNNQKLNYHYDGSGKKLTKVNTPAGYYPTNTEYRGQMVHQYSNGTGSLKYIITSEGRLLNTGTNAAPVWGWEYDLKDHLGNVRVIFKPNATNNGVVRVEYANYFPFGMKMLAPYSTFSGAKYLYNGKEMQDDFGLNWYDYGARMYDATLGRWHTTDNYSEDFYEQSPYSYVSNNPINSIDPDGNFETKFGAWLWKTFNGGGEVLKDKGGEYFVSQKSDYKGEGYGTAVKRTFDWNGRSDGKDMAQEALIEAYRTQYDFSQRLNEAGIEYSYASIGEARFGMLSTASTVLLPNPILKSGTALINSGKAAKKTETLLRAGNAADRGGLTVAGRALQKHGSRTGSVFPKVSGNSAALNQQGEAVLKNIVTNPSVTSTTRHHARFGNVIDYRVPGGQGARFSSDGKKFIHFLEP